MTFDSLPSLPRVLHRDVLFALRAVTQACTLAEQARQAGDFWIHRKPDGSRVTSVDFTVQAMFARLLDGSYPRDSLVAEEDSKILKSNPKGLQDVKRIFRRYVGGEEEIISGIDRGQGEPSDRFWVLDPIDATASFILGGQYAVNCALVTDKKVSLSVVGCPRLQLPGRFYSESPGLLFLAIRDHGAWYAPLGSENSFRRLKVSGRKTLKTSVPILTPRINHDGLCDVDQSLIEGLFWALKLARRPIFAPSPVRYALLAAGLGDFCYKLVFYEDPSSETAYIWDHAPGSLLVEEAGGVVTHLTGRPLDLTQRCTWMDWDDGIVASNGHLHHVAFQAHEDAFFYEAHRPYGFGPYPKFLTGGRSQRPLKGQDFWDLMSREKSRK
jgi:3'(2'), 5'-bisphosphate nucleotidase